MNEIKEGELIWIRTPTVDVQLPVVHIESRVVSVWLTMQACGMEYRHFVSFMRDTGNVALSTSCARPFVTFINMNHSWDDWKLIDKRILT